MHHMYARPLAVQVEETPETTTLQTSIVQLLHSLSHASEFST